MPERLSIAVVCFPSLGGSGIIAAEIAAGLAARGHYVHYVAGDLPSRRLPECPNLLFHEVRPRDDPPFDRPPHGIALAAALIEIANSRPLDLIHAHYAIPHAVSAHLARQVLAPLDPKVVVTLHGTDVTHLCRDSSYRAIIRFALEQSDRITTPSHFLAAEAYRLVGLSPRHAIDVIPNFVDTDHFAPVEVPDRHRFDPLFDARDDAGGPVLFHVSNFRAVKRVRDTIDVLARVREQIPARLVLVGDGPDRLEVARHVAALGLQGSVAFLGKRTEFADDLAHADAFVLPSASESFGVAALEASSCGVPVFGYDVGGVREVVTPETGVLVPALDTMALADALTKALLDDAQRTRLGRAARRRAVTCFHHSAAFDAYEAMYYATLAKGAGSPPAREVG